MCEYLGNMSVLTDFVLFLAVAHSDYAYYLAGQEQNVVDSMSSDIHRHREKLINPYLA